MIKSKRLKPLIHVAGLREHGAAKILIQYRRELAAAEAQLAQLLVYRGEYMQRLEGADIAARQMRDYRAFLAKLNEAIIHQQKQVAQSYQDYERKRSDWYAVRCKSLALNKIGERYRLQEARLASRREQHEQDERGCGTRMKDKF